MRFVAPARLVIGLALSASVGCASLNPFSSTCYDEAYEFSTHAPPSPEQLEAIEQYEREQAAIDDPAAF